MNTKVNIIETTYQTDVSTLEIHLFTFVLIQFSWLALFAPLFMESAFICLLINLAAIWLTILLYSKFTRRPIPTRRSNIDIWSLFYSTIGYIGVIYNASIIALGRGVDGLSLIYDFEDRNLETSIIFIVASGLLIAKITFETLLFNVTSLFGKNMLKEQQAKKRVSESYSRVIKNVIKKSEHRGDQQKALRLLANPSDNKLRYFFKNEQSIFRLGSDYVRKGRKGARAGKGQLRSNSVSYETGGGQGERGNSFGVIDVVKHM